MTAEHETGTEVNLDLLAGRVADLRTMLEPADAFHLASQTGAQFRQTAEGEGEFRLDFWEEEVRVSYPAFEVRKATTGESLPTYLQAMLLYYFTTSDGTQPAGTWISFSELPGGRFYHTAFQGYTGKLVAQVFGNGLITFRQAAEALGGLSLAFGDAAYAFQALPKVPLAVVYWQGEEEFAPVCQILFDSTAGHHLPTDACAILGSNLAKMLIKKAGQL